MNHASIPVNARYLLSIFISISQLVLPVTAIAEEESLILEEVEIKASRKREQESLEPSSTLSADELVKKAASTLGATLQDELGVANSTFGPNVGIPIIRGQHGPRTRVMINGIGTHDASAMSPDHGTTVESLLAKEVKVMRGPAAIRNGGGAIGGAVEITDGRIPERIPKQTTVTSQLRFNTNHDERAIVSEIETGFKSLAFHADVHGRASNDIQIPGNAIDQDALEQVFYSRSPTNTKGYTANTDAKSRGGSLGSTFFADNFDIGVSVSQYANRYGIPLGPPHSHGGTTLDAPEAVNIDMQQDRIDLKGQLFFDNKWLENLVLRVGKTNYIHHELSNGTRQTTFKNDVIESRLELNHHLHENIKGSLGFHDIHRDFSAIGIEAFVPQSQIRTTGFYLVETLNLAPWQFEIGLRKEQSQVQANQQRIWFSPTVSRIIPANDQTFSPESFSFGIQRKHDSGSVTLNRWIAKRAPDIQEMAAFGPHLATRTYDIGSRDLKTETLNGWDIKLQQSIGKLDNQISFFEYQATNYIYQQNEGTVYSGPYFRPQPPGTCTNPVDCLTLMRYSQQDARFHGYEFQSSLPLEIPHLDRFRIGVFADQTRGVFEDETNVPRLAPGRYGLFVNLDKDAWQSELRITRGREQKRTGTIIQPTGVELEPGTDSYLKVDYYLKKPFKYNSFKGDLFLNARNITNAEIRNSTSFLRYYTPELGRNIEVGMRLEF